MEINDLDISQDNADFIITGGKDCKVKIWQAALNYLCFAEFSEHQQEVTQVAFSKNNTNRAFSASADKSFKVYDISAKLCIKTILAPSPITKMVVDTTETMLYIACDNQNIYCYGLEAQQTQEGQKLNK